MPVDEEYAPGLWRPAVLLPFYGLLHIRCYECGKPFWDLTSPSLARNSSALRRYEHHYRAAHIGGRP